MSDAKHTPGPWCSKGRYIWREGETALCVGISEQHRPEASANARLMAAAPDLLAALKLLAKETELSGNHEAADYGWPAAYGAAIAAIKKAEGRK